MVDENEKNVSEDAEANAPPESSADQVALQPQEAVSEPAATAESSESTPEDAAAAEGAAPATPTTDELLAEAGAVAAEESQKQSDEEDVPQRDADADMLAMLDELPQEAAGATPDDINFAAASVSKAEFQQLAEPAGRPETQNIDMLMDVNLPVSIELGRTKMSIADILSLGPGSVVELNKLAGEPVDLLVNFKIVARGEVVVIDENFGVRVTSLISPADRLKALGEDQ